MQAEKIRSIYAVLFVFSLRINSMNWTFSIKNKVQAALTLLVLCGIVFLSNYRLKKISHKVGEAVQSIYEDRLLVQDMVFSYSNLLDKYKLQPNIEKHLTEAQTLKKKFLSTQLTSEESQLIIDFSTKIEEQIEKGILLSQAEISKYKRTLSRLEQIQIEEAQKQMALIKKAKSSQETGYYFETAILIILLVIAQVLISANTIPEQLSKKKYHSN